MAFFTRAQPVNRRIRAIVSTTYMRAKDHSHVLVGIVPDFDKLSCHAVLCCGRVVQHTQTKPRKVSQNAITTVVKSQRGRSMRHGANQVFESLVGPFARGHLSTERVSALRRETYGTHYICPAQQLTSDSFVTQLQHLANALIRFAAEASGNGLPMFTSYGRSAILARLVGPWLASGAIAPRLLASHERSIAMPAPDTPHHTTVVIIGGAIFGCVVAIGGWTAECRF